MDFKVKFMDGTPVPEDYQKKVSQFVSDAVRAEEEIGIEVLDVPKKLSDTAQWYKDILVAQADEANEGRQQYKGRWNTDNWIPMKAKKDIKNKSRVLVLKGEVLLMDKESKHVLTSRDTLQVMMIGKTFALFYCPRNYGVETSMDVNCFEEVK